MLKQLLSDNRIFGAVICVIVFIAGVLIYLQVVKSQANRDVQRTKEIVEQRENPQTGEVASQTANGGHVHADGTYHTGTHETETPAATTTTPAESGVTSQTDITRRTWTGQPQQEMSSPDTLTPEQQKARDARIQKLQAEYKALMRRSESLLNQSSKLQKECEEISRKRDAVMAERSAIRANAELSAEEKKRLRAPLYKQFAELMDLSRAIGADSEARLTESIRLYEKADAISEELEVLRGKRRKSE